MQSCFMSQPWNKSQRISDKIEMSQTIPVFYCKVPRFYFPGYRYAGAPLPRPRDGGWLVSLFLDAKASEISSKPFRGFRANGRILSVYVWWSEQTSPLGKDDKSLPPVASMEPHCIINSYRWTLHPGITCIIRFRCMQWRIASTIAPPLRNWLRFETY